MPDSRTVGLVLVAIITIAAGPSGMYWSRKPLAAVDTAQNSHRPNIACGGRKCKHCDVIGVKKNHEGTSAHFFFLEFCARLRSASRIFRPSAKIFFMISSPANMPTALRQSGGRPSAETRAVSSATCLSKFSTRFDNKSWVMVISLG